MKLAPMLFALALTAPGAAYAVCPPGTIPAMDNFGNNICKSISTGQTRTIERPPAPSGMKTCPNGSFPAMDAFGNSICQNPTSQQRYYDTSKGCPIGTIPGVNAYGSPVCKRP